MGVFKSDDTQGQQRHKGYVQALQEAGIAYDPDKVIWFYTEDRKTHPFERIRQMARDRGNHPFEAVVAYNDQGRRCHHNKGAGCGKIQHDISFTEE